MKREHLLLAALLAAASPAPAAAQFGLHGGVNLSRFVGGDAADVQEKAGLRAGGSIQLLRLGPVAIVPELYYSQKGAKITDDFADDDAPQPTSYDFSLDYLEIPLIAKLSFPLGRARQLRPYVAGGPVYAWNLSCEVSVAGDPQAGVEDCRQQIGSDARTALRNADKGLALGAGLDLAVLGMGTLNLDARLVRGLDRLTTGPGAQPDLKNQAFSLMLGYSFGR